MPRINQLPAASSVASTDVVAIDTQDMTFRVPKSTLFDGYYTAAEVDAAIAQSTAWSNNWLTNTSILAYAASVANPSFTTFRTSATSTDVPIANEYYIGTVERYGQNITVKMTTMQDASKMYINNSVNGGSTWTGWKTFLDSQSTASMFKAKYWKYEPSTGATAGTFIEMATKADLGLTGKTIRGIAVEEVYGGTDIDYNAKVIFNARTQKFVLMPSITQTPIRAHFTVFYSD